MILLRTSIVILVLACPGFSQSSPRPASPAFQALLKDAKARIKEVSITQLKDWLASPEKTVLVDVREDLEWQAGHATPAVHIGRGVLEREIEAAVPDKAARIVVYCQSGGRSSLAADTLQKMGFTNVFSLAGGMQGYRAAGMPVQQ
jgi:rhodanese-related sulfurtransferase